MPTTTKSASRRSAPAAHRTGKAGGTKTGSARSTATKTTVKAKSPAKAVKAPAKAAKATTQTKTTLNNKYPRTPIARPGRSGSNGRRSLLDPDVKHVVPHFPVSTTLYEAGMDKSLGDGVTLSSVVSLGFAKFAARSRNASGGGVVKRKRMIPDKAVDQIRRYQSSGDNPRLNAYLKELADAGYPMKAMAEAMQVSRQAVSLRVQTATNSPKDVTVPAAPTTKERERLLELAAQYTDRSERSFRVEARHYEAAMERFNQMAVDPGVVVESIITDYLTGVLKLPRTSK